MAGPAGWGTSLPPAPGVVLAGQAPEGVLTSLYRRARVVAYVPLREGFGLPVVEAMACGAPVVSSPVPSAGGASLEVDPLDVDAIAAALVSAATDEARRAELHRGRRGPGRRPDLGARRPPPRRAVDGDGRRMSGASPPAPVRVSLDASAIPDPAGGAGRYVLALAAGPGRA